MTPDMTHRNPPDTLEDLRQLTAQELSLPSPLRHVALLLVAAMLTRDRHRFVDQCAAGT